MEKLIVLGTGNAQAIHCYNTCFAMQKGREYFLVDAGGGNGILSALEQAGIPLEHIHHIFITHAHNDHILGMVWMIRMIGASMNQGRYEGSLHIYCHKELEPVIRTLTTLTVGEKFYQHFDERMLFHIAADGDSKNILGDQVTFFDIRSVKEKQFAFSMNMEHGTTLAFLGDEPCRDHLIPYVRETDWLLHEAFCLYRQRDIFHPYEKSHSTVKDACSLAESLSVKNLILWHTEDKDLSHRQQSYLLEGQQYYHGNLYVPADQDIFLFPEEISHT